MPSPTPQPGVEAVAQAPLLALSVLPIFEALALGLLVGWFWGQGHPRRAWVALAVGTVIGVLIYALAFAATGVFDVRNDIR